MIVSDNVIQAEGLGSFLKNLGKISSKAGKKLAKNIKSNSGRALDLSAKIATAAQPNLQRQHYQHYPKSSIFTTLVKACT